jgi:CheY-like chemotaxis protein
VAHDFNNILGIILGHASLLGRAAIAPNEIQDRVDAITKAVERGSGVVRQLLTFARKTELLLQPVSVNQEIADHVKLLSETFPRMIEITTSMEPTLPLIKADRNQLHQVLLNLCVNSRDAILKGSGGGRITISSRLASARSMPDMHSQFGNQEYIEIAVSDTGAGIDEDTRQHIFEPFFTTKEKGKGTGLGLAVVYGVIKSLNGIVDVESSPGNGTTFRLFIPVARMESRIASSVPVSDDEVDGGKETILVVEDEDSLRELLSHFLQAKGYTVLSARDGVEAIDIFKKRSAEIALVFSDMGLPRMSGWDAIRAMQEINASLKAVIASGYIEPETRSKLFESGVNEFVTKPYEPASILKVVRQALDGK